MHLRDKVALITGASRGIGRAIALDLAQAGARVLITGTSAAKLQETLALLHAARADARPLAADIEAPASPAQLVDAALNAWGRLDIVVNNAGVMVRAATADLAPAEWERLMNVST